MKIIPARFGVDHFEISKVEISEAKKREFPLEESSFNANGLHHEEFNRDTL